MWNYFRKKKGEPKETDDNDGLENGNWQLCYAEDCSLIDDQILQNIFNPLRFFLTLRLKNEIPGFFLIGFLNIRAPFERLLQDMYEALGAKWLSLETVETNSFKGKCRSSEKVCLFSVVKEKKIKKIFFVAVNLFTKLNS